MVEYNFNKDFEIEVEDCKKDNEWNILCLNVDLKLSLSKFYDAINNKYLLKVNPLYYWGEVEGRKKEVAQVHESILKLIRKQLGV